MASLEDIATYNKAYQIVQLGIEHMIASRTLIRNQAAYVLGIPSYEHIDTLTAYPRMSHVLWAETISQVAMHLLNKDMAAIEQMRGRIQRSLSYTRHEALTERGKQEALRVMLEELSSQYVAVKDIEFRWHNADSAPHSEAPMIPHAEYQSAYAPTVRVFTRPNSSSASEVFMISSEEETEDERKYMQCAPQLFPAGHPKDGFTAEMELRHMPLDERTEERRKRYELAVDFFRYVATQHKRIRECMEQGVDASTTEAQL